MNKIVSFLSVITASIFLTACPYESAVPVSSPTVKYPVSLLGKWELKNSSDDLFLITKKDEFSFVVTKTKKQPKADDAPEVFEAFLSDVAGVTFLNITEKEDQLSGPGKFYLYKIVISQNETEITLSEVSENIDEQFDNSAALKSFIEKNMQHSFFFTKDDEVYIKTD